MTIQYHPAVEDELRGIQRYYEECSPGLGLQFIEEFEKQVLALAATPGRWMVVSGEIRRCLMRRFPYTIYFRQIGESSIRVTVVKHEKRHPAHGMDRT